MVERLTYPQAQPALTPPPPAVDETREDIPVITVPVAPPPVPPPRAPDRSRANRRWLIALDTLILVPLISASIMIGMHGYKFYVFRQQGIGETSGNGLTENQGPGQPDAPKPPPPPANSCSAGCGTQGG
jgi:hypothetical protein